MLKNQEQARQILEMMDTSLEAAEEIYRLLEQCKKNIYENLASDLHQMFVTIENIAPMLQEEEPELNLPAAITSVRVSLERICQFSHKDVGKALKKVEYELIPLIEDMRLNFYYWGMVFPDKGKIKKYETEEIFHYSRNIYMERAEREGEYSYDISIVVLGYNKLDYTQRCVQSLLEYMPENLRCELILINHGSTDGTKEYFESVHPDKQLDIAVNGGGSTAHARIAEGKYILRVSNDVIITEHAIENLYRCIEADDKIAWAVPSTSNISNLQTIQIDYSDLKGLHEAAAKNNKADLYRHEQRVRLCNPLDIRRTKVFFEIPVEGRMLPGSSFSFPDDQISLLCRRSGYKLMLAKDAYCHHFGSVTIKEEAGQKEADQNYNRGRINFVNKFGVDPWGKGMCYSYQLFHNLRFEKEGHVNILGVNCGLGSNPLKMKECLKETVHNTDITLYNYTDDKRYAEDLKGISDVVHVILRGKVPKKLDEGVAFDYIIIESDLEGKEYREQILGFEKKLSADGMIIAACKTEALRQWFDKRVQNLQIIEWEPGRKECWLCWRRQKHKKEQ